MEGHPLATRTEALLTAISGPLTSLEFCAGTLSAGRGLPEDLAGAMKAAIEALAVLAPVRTHCPIVKRIGHALRNLVMIGRIYSDPLLVGSSLDDADSLEPIARGIERCEAELAAALAAAGMLQTSA